MYGVQRTSTFPTDGLRSHVAALAVRKEALAIQTERRLNQRPAGAGKLPMVSPGHPDGQTAIPSPPTSPKGPASGRASMGPSLPKSPMSQSTSAGSRCSTPNRVPVRALREMTLPQSPQRPAVGRATTELLIVNGNQGGAAVSNSASPVPGTALPLGLPPQGAPTVGSGGLRARRLNQVARPLQVDTSSAVEENEGVKRRIQLVDSVEEHYDIGQTVMPSCHHDMEIRFAQQLLRSSSKDEDGNCCGSLKGREYVVKIRRKPGSFKTQKDESAWRASTELMLNLPRCAGIAQVAEVLEDAAGFYVVMEKVDGLDLHEWLCATGPLDLEGVKEVLRQLLQAVGKLHENGCIHKDLKLENVMLEAANSAPESQASTLSPTLSPSSSKEPVSPASPGRFNVKVVDFDTVEDWSPKSPTATRVLGTDQYIAPEAYEGRYSPASDIFAVGVIAYRLLAGMFPFRNSLFDDKPGENWVGSPKMREIKNRLTNVRLDWQRPNLMALPAQERTMAQRLISRMLAINEAQRPSAQEALLDAWLAPVDTRLVPPSPPPPPPCPPERRRTHARSSIN